MTNRTGAGWIAGAVAATLLLSGCTSQTRVVEGTEVTVAVSERFTSYNEMTSFGSSPGVNAEIVQATNGRFFSYDADLQLVPDESFGSVTVESDDPLTVKYRVADGVEWSDGVPVDAADLLLAWAANSGAVNTEGFDDTPYFDPDSQLHTDDFPADKVFFDGSSGGGLNLVTSTPEIGDDGQSITLVYDEYFVDWPLVFEVGMPAHVVAARALDLEGDDARPEAAKQAMTRAIQDADERALAPISRFFNSGYNFDQTPTDASLLVGTGPYTVTELAADHATLQANPRYEGDHRPSYETVTVRYIADPLQAVTALGDGEVDVIAPRPSIDVIGAIADLDDVQVVAGLDGAHERLDLRTSRSLSGVFDDVRVREAFLKVVPRQRILDELVAPLSDDAQLRSSHVFLPGADGYDTSVAGNGSDAYAEVDVTGARKLLAEAGLTEPTVCILFDASNPRRLTEFQLIQASAARAGFVTTDCSSPDWRDRLGAPEQYDASLYALRADNLAVSAAAASFAGAGGVNNTSGYRNAAVDDLLAEIAKESDAGRRADLLAEVDARVFADAAAVPLYQFPSIAAVDPAVQGVTPSPVGPGLLWNVWDWRPAEAG